MSTVLEKPHDQHRPPEPAAALSAALPPAGDGRSLRVDSLADSVIALLALAVLQRFVGFMRGILVCRWLNPDELGQWDMAFAFLAIAAPLTVLGLPGSFGRYVEYFRGRGQLGHLLRRTGMVCAALSSLAVLTVALARPQFSQLVFGRPDRTDLVLTMAICLAAVIWFNYLTELLTALRRARAGSIVQFCNSLAFAVFSVLLLLVWRGEAISLVAAYGIACSLLIVGMLCFLRVQWRNAPTLEPATKLEASSGFWSRLLPFAAWVWVTNMLYNLFDIVDRYMIVHTSTAADPLAVVGAYHSSRIVPLLLVSTASLLGAIMLPHLSHDWEAGRRALVSARLNFALKLTALLLLAGSIAILLAAPLLFDVAFKGKFTGGKDVLPWTVTYCVWFGLATMAQMYLWCAERARLGCLALLLGLVTNVVLNSLLLPRYGLMGAVLATATANAVVLALMYCFNAALGMRIERSTLLLSLLPITLGFGPWIALAALTAAVVVVFRSDAIFSRSDKQQLTSICQDYQNRIRTLAGIT